MIKRTFRYLIARTLVRKASIPEDYCGKNGKAILEKAIEEGNYNGINLPTSGGERLIPLDKIMEQVYAAGYNYAEYLCDTVKEQEAHFMIPCSGGV